jgi:hypothetical protein
MFQIKPVLILAVGAMLVFAPTAVSASPAAFFASASSAVSDTGDLVVTFDEKGLGNGNIEYAITASSTAVYACLNSSGKRPRAANKESKAGEVSGAGTFTARNGRVHGSVYARPIPPGSFACPSGQQLALFSVAYTRIVLTDTTNGTQVNLPDVSRDL